MSGGFFEYKQYHIDEIADEIKRLISLRKQERLGVKTCKEINEESEHFDIEFTNSLSPEAFEKFKEAVKFLRIAHIYAHRIDWLISGDDGEESFLEQLDEELKEIDL